MQTERCTGRKGDEEFFFEDVRTVSIRRDDRGAPSPRSRPAPPTVAAVALLFSSPPCHLFKESGSLTLVRSLRRPRGAARRAPRQPSSVRGRAAGAATQRRAPARNQRDG